MKSNKEQQDKQKESKPKLIMGRDEMNLAEYPLAVLSKRVSKKYKTIKIDLGAVKNKEGKLVPRRWTVTGSDEFGLPVPNDEEIYVAFMEQTKKNDFESREVFFTRYRILKKMDWPTTGTYYKRVKDALDRLVGLTIYAENVFCLVSCKNLRGLIYPNLISGQFLHRPDMVCYVRCHCWTTVLINARLTPYPETSVIPTEVVIADGKPALGHMILPVL